MFSILAIRPIQTSQQVFVTRKGQPVTSNNVGTVPSWPKSLKFGAISIQESDNYGQKVEITEANSDDEAIQQAETYLRGDGKTPYVTRLYRYVTVSQGQEQGPTSYYLFTKTKAGAAQKRQTEENKKIRQDGQGILMTDITPMSWSDLNYF